MAEKNVRIHNYFSDHIDESPQEYYQKFIDVNILYVKFEDGRECYKPLLPYELYKNNLNFKN